MAETESRERQEEAEARREAWDAIWISAEAYYEEESRTGNSPDRVRDWDAITAKWDAYRSAIEARVRMELEVEYILLKRSTTIIQDAADVEWLLEQRWPSEELPT